MTKHECSLDCTDCDEFQRRLLLTDEGRNALRSRFGDTSNATRNFGKIRTCVRIENGQILGVNEKTPDSVVRAIADGTVVDENTIEIGIIKDPSAGIPGIAAIALERLTEIVPANLLVATIASDNQKSAHFFRSNGFTPEPYEPGCDFVFTRKLR